MRRGVISDRLYVIRYLLYGAQMGTLISFRELNCWQEAAALRRSMRVLTNQFPPEEKYRLTDQIIRAARSVTATIAEGFGRYHYQENARFCRIARGSLNELLDHLIVAQEEQYINEQEFNDYSARIDKCINILNGYIRYLQQAKNSSLSGTREPQSEYTIVQATNNSNI